MLLIVFEIIDKMALHLKSFCPEMGLIEDRCISSIFHQDEEIDSRILLYYISLQEHLKEDHMTTVEIRKYYYGPLSMDVWNWKSVTLLEDKV